jgi:hypothetical protein
MPRFNLTCSLIALAAVSALGAAETTFTDFRFGAGVLSNTYKGSSSTTAVNGAGVSTTTASSETGRNADNNYRGQFQLVSGALGPVGGLILGAGVAINQAQFDNGAQEADVTTPVVDVLIGYGLAVTPRLHFEFTPFAGAGRAYYSVRDQGSSSTSKEWSKYIEYGVKLGAYLTLAGSLQVGIEIPYLVGRFDPEYNHSDATNSYSVSDNRRNQGWGMLLTIGGRF